MTELDTELVCMCGCRFRCPHCDAVPQLRLVSSQVADRLGRGTATTLYDEAAVTAAPAIPARFADRGEAVDEPAYWVDKAGAIAVLCVSEKYLAISGGRLGTWVRRKRLGRAFVWYKPDLEAIAALRSQCEVGFEAALRMYGALVDGRI